MSGCAPRSPHLARGMGPGWLEFAPEIRGDVLPRGRIAGRASASPSARNRSPPPMTLDELSPYRSPRADAGCRSERPLSSQALLRCRGVTAEERLASDPPMPVRRRVAGHPEGARAGNSSAEPSTSKACGLGLLHSGCRGYSLARRLHTILSSSSPSPPIPPSRKTPSR